MKKKAIRKSVKKAKPLPQVIAATRREILAIKLIVLKARLRGVFAALKARIS